MITTRYCLTGTHDEDIATRADFFEQVVGNKEVYSIELRFNVGKGFFKRIEDKYWEYTMVLTEIEPFKFHYGDQIAIQTCMELSENGGYVVIESEEELEIPDNFYCFKIEM